MIIINPFKRNYFPDRCYKADVFCAEDLPDYQQRECGIELGGIVALGFIKNGIHVGVNDTERVTNLEDDAWWTAGLDASPQSHWYVLDTRGSKAAGTPVEEEGFGLNSVERTGDDQEIVFEALGVKDNRGFWAGVNKRTGWGFVTVSRGSGSELVGLYYEDVSVYADIVIDQSIKSRLRFSGFAKLSTDMTPALPFTAPNAIFNP